MKLIETELEELILNPKKEKLILGLLSVVTGREPNYRAGVQNPEYYEIWFYYTFDFNYIVIGWDNFAIDISELTDRAVIDKIYNSFKIGFTDKIEAEEEFRKIQQKLEFNFFSDCWRELENRIGRNIRCFLIEHGILRGVDVNNQVGIRCEEIKGILIKDGIPNHY